MPRIEWNIEMLKSSDRDIMRGVPNDVTNPHGLWLRYRPNQGDSRAFAITTTGVFAEVLRQLAGGEMVRFYWAEDRRRIREALVRQGHVPAEHPHGTSCTILSAKIHEVLDATAGLAGGRAVGFIGEAEPDSAVRRGPGDGWRRLSYLIVLELFDDSVLIEPLTAQTKDVVVAIEAQMQVLGVECRGKR